MKRAIKRAMCAMLAALALMLSACSGQPQKQVDLQAAMQALCEANGLNEGMLELSQDDLLELYGIEAGDVKQFAAQIRLESIQADEIVLIEATDAQAAGRVKDMLDNRYQTKLNETRDYLPDQFEKIERCKVAQSGNFVYMIVCENADKALADFQSALK